MLHLRVECPDSWHGGPDARIVRSCCVFERIVAPSLTLFFRQFRFCLAIKWQGGRMALTSAGSESRTARTTFEEVVVEVSYFALDMAVDFMTSRTEGDGCDQTTFSPIFFQCIEAAGAGRGVLLFVAALPVEGPTRLSAVEGMQNFLD